jgi:Protein of unknown function (DUF2785)
MDGTRRSNPPGSFFKGWGDVMIKGLFAAAALALPVAAQASEAVPCPVAPAERQASLYDAAALIAAPAKLDALIACLADSDPRTRDDFAFTTLAKAMRSEGFPAALVQRGHTKLLAMLDDDRADPYGVRRPFAVIALAEVARYDRINILLAPSERRALAATASAYVRGVTDYRGYVEGEGWRHGVAHGADLIMQLSLNPALHPEDAAAMLDAIAVQVAPSSGHSYVHGESRRLTRPVLFLAASGKLSDDQLAAFFQRLKPDDSPRWRDPYGSLAGLAALHNTRAFAAPLLVDVMRSKDTTVQRMEPPLVDLLRALP